MDVWIRLNGAAVQRPLLVSLEEQFEQILLSHGRPLEVDYLGDAPSEVHQGLTGGPALERGVAAVELGECLLKQRGPELCVRVRVDEGELGVPGAGEEVINDHFDPLPILPEPEPEHPAVAALRVEALARDQDPGQGPRLGGQAGQGGQQPAVAQLALDDVKLGHITRYLQVSSQIMLNLIDPLHHQPRVLAYLVRPEPLDLVSRH